MIVKVSDLCKDFHVLWDSNFSKHNYNCTINIILKTTDHRASRLMNHEYLKLTTATILVQWITIA